MLYDPVKDEPEVYATESVTEIREHLREVIDQCESAELRNPLRAIQAACRQFLTDTRLPTGVTFANIGSGYFLEFYQALGTFRAHVGTSVAVITQTFDIDVDEHVAAILPPPVEEETDGDNAGKA